MMNKRMICIISALFLVSGAFTAAAFAASGAKNIEVSYGDIKVYVDQKKIDLKDAAGNPVEPFIYEGTTYLPVRAVSEALGQEVGWDGKTKSVYIGQQPEGLTTGVEKGELQNGIPYEVRKMTKEEIAAFEALFAASKEGTLENGMVYTYWPMDENARASYDKGINVHAGADGELVWSGKVKVPVLNAGRTNGLQLGDAIKLPTGDEKFGYLVVEFGDTSIDSVNLSVEYADSSVERWELSGTAYSVFTIFPREGSAGTVRVKIGTNESAKEGDFRIYTSHSTDKWWENTKVWKNATY